MALNFTTDINNVSRQIDRYIRDNLPIPKCTLEQYNNLVSATINSQTLESGSTTFPTGSLNSSFPSVSTTNSEAIAANTNRTYILIQNIGDEVVYINFGDPAVLLGGLKLLPGAEFSTQVPQFVEASINAIAEANTSTLAIYEVA